MQKAGFTLIELLVVIIILGVLATIIVPRFLDRGEEAKRVAATVQISSFKTALTMFRLDNGFFPTTEQGLEALVRKPTSEPLPRRWKGYLARIPLDPWGNPYVYISPGIHSPGFDIISFGRDGREGGEGENADIRSWELEAR
jgi:general secretion pathway protein G